ncbi:hypothetical protein SAMN02910298_01957 [Pseudobutyrivibrio sp. YE44]|uniref:hypothetical protein n=1 Tax=Pseudobutyrivibrio sp. YE44 TaxID=1520802 RepID=UPI00088E543A|nr:hypothetical protein [Pseudobutyrivibrio sp. YE44]SDB40082.1 hypothetical protein SAMN02910298_01957 [Pseudobutyrivibrio sp. YE44]
MSTKFKLYSEEFTQLLSTYEADVASINHQKEEITTADTKNIMLEKYVDMFGTILDSVNSYKQLIAANTSSVEKVVSELKDMDDDLQNNF